VLAIALACVAGPAPAARDYPASTVRMLVPVAPGGPLDLTARLLAEHFSATWKQPVIVENRPGSATLLATRAVAQADPNGYTLLLASSSLSSYSAFFKDPRVDMRKDLAFVSLVARVPMFLAVSATEKLGSVSDLVALAKARPGHLNYATYGNANRVMTELFNRALQIQVTHIGYPGAAPAAQALMRGDVAYMLDSMSTLQPLIAGGKVKVLAVTEPSRVSAFPSTPTLKEAGYAMPDFSVWYGLVAPAGTAAEITDKLSSEVAVFSKSPRAKTSLEGLGFSLTSSSPEEFRQTVLKGEAVFQEISRSLGIQPE
jgi:tripartite-type tricarboxylate transporter receptor subunit TctC